MGPLRLRLVPRFSQLDPVNNRQRIKSYRGKKRRKSAKRNIKTFFLIKLISTFILKGRFITTRDVCLTGGKIFRLFLADWDWTWCGIRGFFFYLLLLRRLLSAVKPEPTDRPTDRRRPCVSVWGKLLSIYCFIIYVHGSR